MFTLCDLRFLLCSLDLDVLVLSLTCSSWCVSSTAWESFAGRQRLLQVGESRLRVVFLNVWLKESTPHESELQCLFWSKGWLWFCQEDWLRAENVDFLWDAWICCAWDHIEQGKLTKTTEIILNKVNSPKQLRSYWTRRICSTVFDLHGRSSPDDVDDILARQPISTRPKVDPT